MVDLDDANRQLSATLRAYERMQGALERHVDVAAFRANEARRLVGIQAVGVESPIAFVVANLLTRSPPSFGILDWIGPDREW